jgi:predicted metalloprotease with PDZ domain
MKKLLLVTLLLITINGISQTTRYEVSFPNYIHHEANIKVSFPKSKGMTTVRMSRSSPGRYATHEFGKNVYRVKAYDSASGKSIPIVQKEGDVYSFLYTEGTLVVEYTLFGDLVDGTYAAIDRTHAHFNMPAAFMWALGKENRPIEIQFNVPESLNWKVATQLKPGRNAYAFWAPNLQYFMDSPTELSDYKKRSWTVKEVNGKEKTLEIVLHGDASDELLDEFTEGVKKIVEQARAVYGELPDFDYGKYTFLFDLMPANGGDGMEHRNSTCITGRAGKLTKETLMARFGVSAHEFFHCWNVERIRPKTLEPFDFSKANMSDELWVSEGFTQYYGSLLLARAGLMKQDQFLSSQGFYFFGMMNNNGGKYFTPIQASRLAVFTDAATAIDKTNFSNIFYSYYSYGAAIAGVLDISLRTQFNKTLDEYMRILWQKHGKKEVAFTVPDLQVALAQLTNANFAKQFFDEYVYGIKRSPLDPMLAKMGLELINPNAGKPSIGALAFKQDAPVAEVSSNIAWGSPLYDAGIETGDVINLLDGKEIKTIGDVNNIVSAKKIGDELPVVFTSRGVKVEGKIKTIESTGFQLRIKDGATDAEKQKINNWLGNNN